MRIVFNRGSDSMPSEQVEEYLKTIYDIAGKNRAARTTEIAKCLKNRQQVLQKRFSIWRKRVLSSMRLIKELL